MYTRLAVILLRCYDFPNVSLVTNFILQNQNGLCFLFMYPMLILQQNRKYTGLLAKSKTSQETLAFNLNYSIYTKQLSLARKDFVEIRPAGSTPITKRNSFCKWWAKVRSLKQWTKFYLWLENLPVGAWKNQVISARLNNCITISTSEPKLLQQETTCFIVFKPFIFRKCWSSLSLSTNFWKLFLLYIFFPILMILMNLKSRKRVLWFIRNQVKGNINLRFHLFSPPCYHLCMYLSFIHVFIIYANWCIF